MQKLLYILFMVVQLAGYSQTTKDVTNITPSLLWSVHTAGPLIGSAVTDGNVVYFGSADHHLYAVQITNGNLLWKYPTGGTIRSTPLMVGENIIVNSGDGILYCLDKKGKPVWKFTTGGEKNYALYSYADYYHSSPVADGNMIYFGSGDHHIYAVDATTGKLVWKYLTGDVVHSRGATDREQVYFGSFDGHLYALDKRTGAFKWKFKSVGHRFFPKGEMQGNVTVFGNKVYIGSRDYNLYAVDTKGGYGLWNLAFPKGWAMGSPVVQDSVLYVGTSDDMVLMAIDPFTGVTRWKTALKFNVFGGVAVKDDVIYVGNLMGKLFAIDKTSGNIIWVFKTEAYLQHRKKYFNEDDNYRNDIQSIITKGDDFLTMYYDLGAIFSTPAISGNNLVITSTDGKVYCFRSKH
ncbi:MAG TPA: PQQ-binding-like beta-propeller repeat protein [Chitinophagaceae bacterium]